MSSYCQDLPSGHTEKILELNNLFDRNLFYQNLSLTCSVVVRFNKTVESTLLNIYQPYRSLPSGA